MNKILLFAAALFLTLSANAQNFIIIGPGVGASGGASAGAVAPVSDDPNQTSPLESQTYTDIIWGTARAGVPALRFTPNSDGEVTINYSGVVSSGTGGLYVLDTPVTQDLDEDLNSSVISPGVSNSIFNTVLNNRLTPDITEIEYTISVLADIEHTIVIFAGGRSTLLSAQISVTSDVIGEVTSLSELEGIHEELQLSINGVTDTASRQVFGSFFGSTAMRTDQYHISENPAVVGDRSDGQIAIELNVPKTLYVVAPMINSSGESLFRYQAFAFDVTWDGTALSYLTTDGRDISNIAMFSIGPPVDTTIFDWQILSYNDMENASTGLFAMQDPDFDLFFNGVTEGFGHSGLDQRIIALEMRISDLESVVDGN